MGRRCEQRIEVNLPVRVWGLDQNGHPFLQSAYTVNVTKNGARLRDLFCVAKAGEVIRIQQGLKKANFSVRWIGHPGTQADGHVGIHCMEPDKYIWGVPLPKTNPPDTFAAGKPDSSSQHQARAAGAGAPNHFRTSPSAGVSKGPPIEALRLQKRFACTGTAEVAPEGGNVPLWCGLSDLSVSGCYAETTSPFPVNTRVFIRLKIFGAQLTAHGTVRNSHAGVGMGISLSDMSNAEQRQLHSILEALAAGNDSGVTLTADSNPVSFTPEATAAPVNDRSLLSAHNRPRQEYRNKVPAADSELVPRLQDLTNELEALPQIIRPDMVDARIVHDFKSAAEIARRMASTVQLWMELQSQNRDPFHLLHQVTEERVHAAAAANRHLVASLDGNEIDFDTDGLKELFESARDLHTRLQKLFKKG